MTFAEFLRIIRARWIAVLVPALLIIVGVVVASLSFPKKYTAETQVVIDLKPDFLAGQSQQTLMSSRYLATQVDVASSVKVALSVVDRLDLSKSQLAIDQWREATGGLGSLERYYANLLRKDLEVTPARTSTVLTIGYSGTDPDFSAAVANEFAQAYARTNIEMKTTPALQQNAWFERQSAELRRRLDEARGRLSQYQRANDIVSADERLDIETRRLQELSSELTRLEATSIASNLQTSQARAALKAGAGSTLPNVIGNGLVVELKSIVSRKRAQLSELLTVFGDQHPQILRLTKEIAELQVRIASETKTIVGSLSQLSSTNSKRFKEITTGLELQRQKVLSLKKTRDAIGALERDVNNAQIAYDGVLQKLNQTSLQSQADQANVFVLTPAVAPASHSSPKTLLNALVACLLGPLIGIGFALLQEFSKRPVRSASDLESLTGVPTFGAIRRDLRLTKKIDDHTASRLPAIRDRRLTDRDSV